MSSYKYKHLTLNDRIIIQKALKEGQTYVEIGKKPYFKSFVILKSTLAILISSWHCFRKTYFCFQGADSEVNLAKIIQTEVTFAKRKLNLLFTFLRFD